MDRPRCIRFRNPLTNPLAPPGFLDSVGQVNLSSVQHDRLAARESMTFSAASISVPVEWRDLYSIAP